MSLPRTIAGLACAAALAGCAVGPDFHTPAPPVEQTYRGISEPATVGQGPGLRDGGQRLVRGAEPDAGWWRAFGSSELDGLVASALTRNADLAAASAALRQARETYLAARGELLPNADLQVQAQRARNSESLAPPLANNASVYSLFSGQLNVSYALDVFGRTRRAVEAAAAQSEQQRFQSEAAYLSLTGNLVTAFVQLAALRDQLRLSEELVAVDQRLVALTRSQRDQGQISGIDLAAVEAQLAQARNGLPALRKQLAQQTDLLAILCGETPATFPAPQARLTDLRLPAELPLSVPSQMVRQRPDVRAAEAAVHAASAQLGVAIAARLPDLSLSAAIGGASSQIGSVLSPANQLWSITGAIAQPIFRGGALMHQQRAARAALEQAQAQYRSAVLTGFQNVSDALAAMDADAEALRTEEAAESAARRQAQLVELQHGAGQVSGLNSLAAKATELQASISRVQGEAARLSDSVALIAALGGGWQSRRDFADAAGAAPKACSAGMPGAPSRDGCH